MLGNGLDSLKVEASGFRGSTFATSTKKTYRSQATCYTKFCLNFGLVPVPASQETLVTYCAFLARTLSSSSIPGYLNVVRIMHLEAGFKNPLQDNWELSSVQRGISRLLGKPPKQKSPITVAILLDLFRTVEVHAADTAFWAACLVAFFGFLRKSTLLPSNDMFLLGKFISRGDIADLTLSSFNLVIRQSKTIQFGQRVLTLPYVSATDVRLCPVRAVLRHFGVSKLGSSRPLFNYVVSGVEIQFTHAFFVKRLKAGLLQTGNRASDISCHSFRRGGATLGFSIGMSAIDIKLRGDWRSNAYERYLVVSPDQNVKSVRALTVGASRLAAL
jgi:integrase